MTPEARADSVGRMAAFYNDHDKHCAAWMRNLVNAGLIADGHVDSRSVVDVSAGDLVGHQQVHLFAGIGLWSHALRLAGIGDDHEVWTCSCPCQPFSQAGRGKGVFDDRHLWPAAHWLVGNRRPPLVFGEQVASPDGIAWLDIVSADLEAIGYTVRATVLASCGLGAPNIRQRIYWVADRFRLADAGGERRAEGWRHYAATGNDVPRGDSAIGGLADADRERFTRGLGKQQIGEYRHEPGNGSRLGDTACERSPIGTCEQDARHPSGQSDGPGIGGGMGDAISRRLSYATTPLTDGAGRLAGGAAVGSAGRAHNPWRSLEWIDCLDGRRRPTWWIAEPELQRVVTGDPAGVGFVRTNSGADSTVLWPLKQRQKGDVAKLRAYGNAINPIVAAEFIRACLETR